MIHEISWEFLSSTEVILKENSLGQGVFRLHCPNSPTEQTELEQNVYKLDFQLSAPLAPRISRKIKHVIKIAFQQLNEII